MVGHNAEQIRVNEAVQIAPGTVDQSLVTGRLRFTGHGSFAAAIAASRKWTVFSWREV